MPSELESIACKIGSIIGKSNLSYEEINMYIDDVMTDIDKQFEKSTKDNRDMLLELRLYRLATQLYETASKIVVPEFNSAIIMPSLYWRSRARRIEIDYNPEAKASKENEA